MTCSNYLNNSLRLSERHKGDPPENNYFLPLNKGRFFPNKGWLLRDKAGLLQNPEIIFTFLPSAVDFMLFYTLLKAILPNSL